MQDVAKVLEWSRVAEKLASYCRSSRGKDLSLTLVPYELDVLKEELAKLEEMQKCLDLLGRLPIDVSSDLLHVYDLASKGACLGVEDIERVAHDVVVSADIKRYFSHAFEAPLLRQKAEALPDMAFLEADIHKIIAPDMSIYDDASTTLRHIRISIKRLEKQMEETLGYILSENAEFLSDATLTMRNGHYVLPVANANKHKVKGIVQDISGSGGTTFIEPEKLVSLNNKMVELRNEEREEIHRLLLELSGEIGSSKESLQAINLAIGYFDFVQAKALYGQEIKGHVASLSETGELFLPAARHPLLDPEKVVPNDFAIHPTQKVIIISGPNAGGKTVALKTVGLLCLMFECALPLPTKEGAIMPYFRRLYADIGDSQSLSDNLSTFSGHMRNLADIAEVVGGKDLVLLDEVGTGTSPREGESLAKAVALFLLSKHCTALISSHFEGLKAFAFEHGDVENACMLYDDERLLPTYKIKMGLPGESYGLKVARRFGVPEEIVASAEKELQSQTDLSVSEAIDRLAKLAKEAEDLKEELAKEKAKVASREAAVSAHEAQLQKREDAYLATVKEEKARLIEETKKKIAAIMDALNSPEVKLHQAIAAKKRLEELAEREEEATYGTQEVKEGDYVEIPSLDVVGRVLSLKGKRLHLQTRDGLSFDTTIDKVRKTKEPEAKKEKKIGSMVDRAGFGESVPLELNLIGMHVDEAMGALDSYLDKCRLRGYDKVRIIHGFGSGALRTATHDYLKKHDGFVESFSLGGQYDGGSGATVVVLKSAKGKKK